MSIVNEEGLDVKKKHIVIAMMAFIILLSVAYLQWGRKERVVNSFSTASDTSYTQEFSVIANTLFLNKNEYAKDLIAKTLHNGFQNIRFSYDVGFPEQIQSTFTKTDLSITMEEKIFESYIHKKGIIR